MIQLERPLLTRKHKTNILHVSNVYLKDMWKFFFIHYMDKSIQTPDHYTSGECNDIVFKYIYTLIWSWSPFCSYNSFHSSWKAFHKILECFCGNWCPFILQSIYPTPVSDLINALHTYMYIYIYNVCAYLCLTLKAWLSLSQS